MNLCVTFSDHDASPDWSVSFCKGGLPEDRQAPSDWIAAGKLMVWFFSPGRKKLKPNTVRETYEFELFNDSWWYGNEMVVR